MASSDDDAVPGVEGREAAPGTVVKLTPTQIAADWGTSRAYASKKIKEGCPTDSLAAAREWRIKNSRYGVGYRSKGGAVAVDSAGGVGAPIEVAGKGTKRGISDRARGAGPVEARDLSGIEASLLAAIEVEQEAHRMVIEAQRSKNDTLLGVRIAAYNKAQGNRLQAETAVQEYLEKQKRLVDIDTVREILRKAWVPLLARLRSCVKRAALKANPADDVHAEAVFSEEIEAAIAEARLEFV